MNALAKLDPRMLERRRHARVTIEIVGRLMLEDRQEYSCETVDASPGGLLLRSDAPAQAAEKVVAYLDYLGRVEGIVVRTTPQGFALKLALPPAKRDRIADLLTWLANRPAFGDIEDRRHQRIVPHIAETTLQIGPDTCVPARIIDISISGAGVEVEKQPAIGTRVVVGKTPGKVVRHLPNGIAIEFLRLVPSETFDEDIVL